MWGDATVPLIPAKAGTQCCPAERRRLGIEVGGTPAPAHHPKNWVPAFAGMSGV